MQQQAQQQGTPVEQLNPQDAMPDPEQFVNDFNEKYIDDESKQGQDMLDFIRRYFSISFCLFSLVFCWRMLYLY